MWVEPKTLYVPMEYGSFQDINAYYFLTISMLLSNLLTFYLIITLTTDY